MVPYVILKFPGKVGTAEESLIDRVGTMLMKQRRAQAV